MAEVTARKRGTKWEYRFEMATVDGKRKQFSKGGFNTKREAMKAGSEAFSQYNRCGVVFKPADISVSDFIDFWYQNYCLKQLKVKTCESYIAVANNEIRPYFGKYKLSAIKAENIITWLDWLVEKGLKITTIKCSKNILSCMFRYAVTPLKYIEHNPVSNISLPKIKKMKDDRKLLSPVDFNNLLSFVSNKYRVYRTALYIGFYAGLRGTETISLTWDDIDLENRVIHVRKQIINNKKSTLKTDKSERDIPIGETLISFLRHEKKSQEAFRKDYDEYYMYYCINENDDLETCDKIHENADFVCRYDNGNRLKQKGLIDFCRKLSRKVGYHFTFHMLRHSHATILAIGNTPVKAIQERLGHSNADMTLNVYMHSTLEQAKLASDIFERLAHAK